MPQNRRKYIRRFGENHDFTSGYISAKPSIYRQNQSVVTPIDNTRVSQKYNRPAAKYRPIQSRSLTQQRDVIKGNGKIFPKENTVDSKLAKLKESIKKAESNNRERKLYDKATKYLNDYYSAPTISNFFNKMKDNSVPFNPNGNLITGTPPIASTTSGVNFIKNSKSSNIWRLLDSSVDYTSPVGSQKFKEAVRDRAIKYALNGEQPINITKGTKVKPELLGYTREELPYPTIITDEFRKAILPRLVNNRIKNITKQSKRFGYDDWSLRQWINNNRSQYKKIYDDIKNEKYIEASEQVFNDYNRPNSGRTIGFYDTDSRKVVSKKGVNPRRVLGHELRHWLDYGSVPLIQFERDLLKKAYNEEFDRIPLTYQGYDKDYDMNPERVTTNRDLRRWLLGDKINKLSIKDQNKIIDRLSKDKIIQGLQEANGYSYHYWDLLDSEGNITDELIQNLKNAMKYVGGVAVPGMIAYGMQDRNNYKNGGTIHINPANRGKFNATKRRTGKTTEELTHSKNPKTRKRAIFAQNAAKWRKRS